MASSKKQAELIFESDIQDSNDDARPEYKQHTKIDDVDIFQSVAQSSFSATATESMMMKLENYVNYNFIPHDDFF